MTEYEIKNLAECALTAGVSFILRQLDHADGDVAAQFFDEDTEKIILDTYKEYIKMEIELGR